MKKKEKKIIGIFLLLLLISSQISPLFAATDSTETIKTLEEYLIDNGVDTNKDGTLSAEEWATVKNLNLDGKEVDITGIEKAVDLKSLNMENCDISNIDFLKLSELEFLNVYCDLDVKIDFSVISNAENLRYIHLRGDLADSVSNIDFSKLQKLESAYIQNNNNVTSVDLKRISDATNLVSLSIYNNCDISDIDFSKLQKLKDISFSPGNQIGKSINLDGILEAVNLKSLSISTSADISTLDFSKLQNLESLYIDEIYENFSELNFPSMNNLKYLAINSYLWGGSIEQINLSKLNSLEELHINSNDTRNLILPKFKNIKSVYIESTFNENDVKKVSDFELDIENCTDISGTVLISDYGKIKLNENCMTEVITSEFEGLSKVKITEHPTEIILYKDGREYNTDFGDVKVECEENNIVSLKKDDTGYNLDGKNIGTQNITIIDGLERRIEVLVTVKETPTNNVNKELGDGSISAEFVDTGTILKSNGELWKINSETTAEKIDTNVEEYISCWSYSGDGEIMQIENKLKQNNKLVIDVIGNTWNYVGEPTEFISTTIVENVKGIGPNIYLTTNGELFEIYYNYIVEQVQTKKLRENVKKIIGDCIILEDGTTWCQDKYDNYMEGIYGRVKEFFKVADFEIKDAGWYRYEGDTYWCIVDLNNNLYGYDDYYGWIMTWNNEIYSNEMTLLKENFVNYYSNNGNWMFYEREIKDNMVLDFFTDNGQKLVLSNIARADTYWSVTEVDVLIRTDGTIWTYSDEYGLTKITKSTFIEDNEEDSPIVEKDKYITNESIKDKVVGENTVISGMGVNKKIETLVNDFNKEYTVKVFDSNNQEVASTKLLGTGLIVKLYDKNNKVVKDYVVLIYGDTTGDGVINAVDALTLIKGINNKVPFKSRVHKEAGNIVAASGQTPTAVDALAIVKAANNKYTINQSK